MCILTPFLTTDKSIVYNPDPSITYGIMLQSFSEYFKYKNLHTLAKNTESTSTYILISAYLEEPSIRSVINDLKKHGYQNIIVVDDGSSDNTYGELLKTHGIIITQHLINRGKGAGIRTGMETAKTLGASIVVTFDGDGQHNPADIKKLLAAIDEGFDVALGTRMGDISNMPFTKRIANYIANISTWMLFGLWVSDSQCGLRAFSKKSVDLIETKSDRYAYDPEVLKEIKKHKLSFKEVPIDALYNEHSQTKAERQNFTTGIKTLLKMITSA